MSKVLVVDDDHRIALSIAVRLKQAGHEVVEANDGVVAMKRAMEESPDLVLLDISMPAGNGFIVAERLRENVATATVPIIFMTASKRHDFRARAAQFQPVGFVAKPFEADQLLEMVTEALEVKPV